MRTLKSIVGAVVRWGLSNIDYANLRARNSRVLRGGPLIENTTYPPLCINRASLRDSG